jgi:hypothetical protein
MLSDQCHGDIQKNRCIKYIEVQLLYALVTSHNPVLTHNSLFSYDFFKFLKHYFRGFFEPK